jgi:small subunit ribosomal protein S5
LTTTNTETEKKPLADSQPGSYGKNKNKRKRKEDTDKEERLEKVIQISRVTKVVKGGKRMSFRAAIVVGDKQGSVGIGIGKAVEVPSAIQKGIAKARKHMVKCPLLGGTIPHPSVGFCGASKVLLRPAPPGTGVIAGGAARTVLELVGLADIVAKSLGSANAINVAKAAIDGLRKLKSKQLVEEMLGKTLSVHVPGVVKNKAEIVAAASNAQGKKNKFELVTVPLKKVREKKKEVIKPAAEAPIEAAAPAVKAEIVEAVAEGQ